MNLSGHTGRAGALAGLCAGLVLAGAIALRPEIASGLTAAAALAGHGPVDGATALSDVLVGLAAAAVEAVAVWACLVALVITLEIARGRPTRVSGAVPSWARRLVLLVCGAALIGGGPAVAAPATPASTAGSTAGSTAASTHGTARASIGADGGAARLSRPATSVAHTLRAEQDVTRHADAEAARAPYWSGGSSTHSSDHPGVHGRDPLSGLPYPDRATGGARPGADVPPSVQARPQAQPQAEPQAQPQAPAMVEVATGDSLWSLAAATLPDGASVTEVARATHRLYAANRVVIGDDPDLIRPGLMLRLPRLPRARQP